MSVDNNTLGRVGLSEREEKSKSKYDGHQGKKNIRCTAQREEEEVDDE